MRERIPKSILILIALSLSPAAVKTEKTEFENLTEGELVFAQVIFRHGARAPTHLTPWMDAHEWPNGMAQLTKIGKQQQYALGKWLRQRYDTLLSSSKYLLDSVYMQSTDFDRTLMSAALVNAGLFPPSGEEIWHEQLHWQPMPVHTVPRERDAVLGMSAPCAAYDKAFRAYRQSDCYEEILASYEPLFKQLSHITGHNITTTGQVLHILDYLIILRYHNKTLPTWAQDSHLMHTMRAASVDFFADFTNTPSLARLYAGPLIKELVEHFEQKITEKLKPDHKLWLYSAHDNIIIGVLNSLDMYDRTIPTFSSSLLFELRHDVQQNIYYVSIFYRNAQEEDPKPLLIPKCGTACPLKKFRQLYQHLMPDSFEEECEGGQTLRMLHTYIISRN